MGQTDNKELKITLARKFLTLVSQTDPLPSHVCFYGDGVKLCLTGSPVLEELDLLVDRGVHLILCSTCLSTFGVRDQVAIGEVGGMSEIVAAMMNASDTITL